MVPDCWNDSILFRIAVDEKETYCHVPKWRSFILNLASDQKNNAPDMVNTGNVWAGKDIYWQPSVGKHTTQVKILPLRIQNGSTTVHPEKSKSDSWCGNLRQIWLTQIFQRVIFYLSMIRGLTFMTYHAEATSPVFHNQMKLFLIDVVYTPPFLVNFLIDEVMTG